MKLSASFKMVPVIVLCSLLWPVLICTAQAPSRAQVLQAQNYFIKRNLLPQLVSLTKDDREQATRFSDVIIACYEIFQELEKFEVKQLIADENFNTIQDSLAGLQEELSSVSKNLELKLSDKVQKDQGDEGLDELKVKVEKLEKLAKLERFEKLEKLEQVLLDMKLNDEKNQKSMKNLKLISTGSALFIGIVTLLAAL